MSLKAIVLAGLAAAPGLAAPSLAPRAAGDPVCFPVSIDVHATANNFKWQDPPNPDNEQSIINFFQQSLSATGVNVTGTTAVSQAAAIKGRYCQPPPAAGHTPDLIILGAGLTYNKSYWNGFGLPTYNYQLFAGRRGYATLAIDRLSTGDSPTHPDPINIIQVPLQVELLHAVVQRVRAINRLTGSLRPWSQIFGKVAYAGHSFGSVLGTALSAKYPADFDAFIFTGLSVDVYPPAVVDFTFGSGATHFPRFHGLPLGYLVITTLTDRTNAFYAGNFDPAVPLIDFKYGDIGAVGEFATVTRALAGPSPYTGPVAMVAGGLDPVVCNTIFGDCATILANSNVLFPSSTNFFTYVAPDSGHCINLHRTAPATFKAITDWLDSAL